MCFDPSASLRTGKLSTNGESFSVLPLALSLSKGERIDTVMVLKQFACAFAAVLLLASLASSAELRRITFGYSTVGSQATGVWMAKEIGAFEKHGIHADLIYIASGPVVVQALIGGDLHGGIGASNA
ncbi:MAG: ABC transporter substrate-binding protein, partial [Candidatus Binatia bacterium]